VVVIVGRSVLRTLRGGSGWLVGLSAGLVAHLAGQLLLFPIVELEPLVWLLAGVVVASSGPAPARARRVPRVLPIVLGALTAVALVAGVLDVAADRQAGRAVDRLARGDHRAAASAAEDAVAWRPDTVRLRVLAASALVADDQGTLAGLRHLDRALDVSPGDPIVLLHRARLLVERAEATQVPAHLTRAEGEVDERLDADPYNAALWRLQARLARLRGDPDGEREATTRADDLTPPDQLEP
jgi:predicted Zn-dependent protease